MDGGLWYNISPEAKELISNMICPQEQRMTAREAFQHPWFELARQFDEGQMIEQQHDSQLVKNALYNLKTFSNKSKVK